MDSGIQGSRRTVAVLSGAYLQSVYGRKEWTAAYARNPDGFRTSLVPVRVEDCERPGLLAAVVSIDLFNAPAEIAKSRLLAGIRASLTGADRPSIQPPFPGFRFNGQDPLIPDSKAGTHPPLKSPPETEPDFPGPDPHSGEAGGRRPGRHSRRPVIRSSEFRRRHQTWRARFDGPAREQRPEDYAFPLIFFAGPALLAFFFTISLGSLVGTLASVVTCLFGTGLAVWKLIYNRFCRPYLLVSADGLHTRLGPKGLFKKYSLPWPEIDSVWFDYDDRREEFMVRVKPHTDMAASPYIRRRSPPMIDGVTKCVTFWSLPDLGEPQPRDMRDALRTYAGSAYVKAPGRNGRLRGLSP
jgi:TIR domain